MFTKKLEDQFSADLLNTVRGVLGEAKHDKECECEKCEKEEDDEDEKDEMKKEGYVSHAQRKAVWANRADDGEGHPDKKKKVKKEGYMPTADEPSAKDKKVAQKIRDMMAKEKKPVKEDSEQTDILEGGYRSRMAQRNKDTRAQWIDNRDRELKAKNKEQDTNKLTKEDSEQIDELSKPTMGRYINKAKDSIDMASYRQGEYHGDIGSPRYNNLEKKLSKRHRGIETAVKKLTKEESEQIDELSKATMGSYINKAAERIGTKGVTAGLKIAADEKSSGNFKDMGKRQKGIAKAVSKLTKEEQDFIDALNTDSLEEGRGRPPKEGSAAWHAKKKQDNDDMPALGVQLRKARSINKKVRFMNGKEHDIHHNHINRFEDHMAARKTSQDKAAFQKQAHKSHEDFVKAVSAPVPKAAKDTGEIVRYR